jgi:hypothetical protein
MGNRWGIIQKAGRQIVAGFFTNGPALSDSACDVPRTLPDLT